MSYLDDVANEFVDMLKNGAPSSDELTRFIISKLKESYRNGAAAERKRRQHQTDKPKPKSKASK